MDSFKTISTSLYVSAIWQHPSKLFARGTVSADLINFEKKTWWISRALVQPEEFRNQGIGSKMLKNVIDAITLLNGSEIFVIPDGYEYNTKRQFNFYIKNGFVLGSYEQDEGLIYSIKR